MAPLYDFKCAACGDLLEVLHPKEPLPETCSECGGVMVKQVSVIHRHHSWGGWQAPDNPPREWSSNTKDD